MLQKDAAPLTVGDMPYATVFDPLRQRLFVTNQSDSSVSVLDLVDQHEIARIPVGDYPEGIDMQVEARRVYVANWMSNDVTVINADSLEVERSIATGNGSRAFGRFILH